MSQVITDAFASYWQQCLVDETPVELDEFVLAYVPGLDPDAPIDPASGLPLPEQIVHRHAVDQRGRINNDAVAYSIVMDTTVGDFTFNAMYLINSALNLVAMIVHKGDETKLKTDPANGQTGNSLVKSMLMEYDRAAEASETVIDASTWQIDYAARLRGMDEDLRRQALGTFGQAAFYGDGFKLVNASGLYKVQPGQGYVGGLLVELTSEQEVTPSAKPVSLWLDVYRAGTLLSPWVNHLTLTLSAADLVDYVDANGYPHFVTKLAVINADDSVTDTRARRTLTLTGDVTGEASVNGPDSIQLEVAIKDNSHGHTIENVAGLAQALEGKAETGHTHTPGDAGAAPAVHGHAISDVSGLQGALDGKSPSGHAHTPAEAGAAPAEHGHAIADVSGLQGALDGKSPTGHTHTPAEAGAAPAGYGLGETSAPEYVGGVQTRNSFFKGFVEDGWPANGAGVQCGYNPNRRGQIFVGTGGTLHYRFSLSEEPIDNSTPWSRAVSAQELFNNIFSAAVGTNRVLGVTYTNTGGLPMMLEIAVNSGSGVQGSAFIDVNGVSTANTFVDDSTADGGHMSVMVPGGATYRVRVNSSSVAIGWVEVS